MKLSRVHVIGTTFHVPGVVEPTHMLSSTSADESKRVGLRLVCSPGQHYVLVSRSGKVIGIIPAQCCILIPLDGEDLLPEFEQASRPTPKPLAAIPVVMPGKNKS